MRKQLEAMSSELRELMVYQCPKELGALYTEVEAMMKEMGKEQSILIAQQMRDQARASQIKARHIKKLKHQAYCWVITVISTLYIIWLIWAIVQIRITEHPELGRCLIPKGQWPYQHYNNLKWIDCELNERDYGRT